MSLSAPSSRAAFAALLTALSLIVMLAAGAFATRARQTTWAPPARGHASVIAQGIVIPPDPEAIWRVTSFELDAGQPKIELAADDVLVVDRGALITDEGTGRRALLLPGEASFQPRSVHLADATATGAAFAIELAPNDAPDPEAGTASYAGPAFVPPTGPRDFDLVRDVLEPGESTTVIGQETPVLVLATAGAIDVKATDGTSARFRAGEAGAFSGDVIVTGLGDDASSFVAAVIGQEIVESSP
ncbi:MAG: hypothetical protein IT337_00485, partial [Thermomicrobiales bacterium]|nr:hypothetical protein [Thermomicrobiales bacterium]